MAPREYTIFIFIFCILALAASCSPGEKESRVSEKAETETVPSPKAPPAPQPQTKRFEAGAKYKAEILAEYPHDPESYTQGLIFNDGFLLETSGGRGNSSLRKVEIESGDIVLEKPLPAQYFAEGIALRDGKIYMLTWTSGQCLVFDEGAFKATGAYVYSGEGWGLTFDGAKFIRSDGSDRLYFHDLESFALSGEIAVFDDGGPLRRLNELEYFSGEIWANVYGSDYIARIDPAAGAVVGKIDLSFLRERLSNPKSEVMNGIACDEKSGAIFVTGKNWDKLFKIKLVRED